MNNDWSPLYSYALKNGLFPPQVLELKCGCYILPIRWNPGSMWAEVHVEGRMLRFGCEITILSEPNKWKNKTHGRCARYALARQPDPLALALYTEAK